MAKKKKKTTLKKFVVATQVTVTQYRYIEAASKELAIEEADELEGNHGEEYDYDEAESEGKFLYAEEIIKKVGTNGQEKED